MSSAAASETFSVTVGQTRAQAQAEVEVVSRADVDSAAETVAHYVGADVRYLVRAAHIDLRRELNVPPSITEENDVVAVLLEHDIERMLRRSLIREVQLILSDQDPNANNQIAARYQAHYEVRGSTARRGTGIANGIVQAPAATLENAHFALLISWSAHVTRDTKLHVGPTDYFFTWTPSRQNFDTSGLVRYRWGGIDAGPIQVARTEAAQLQYLS